MIQVEKSFLQNERGIEGWLETPKRKKQGVITHQSCTKLHDTIPILSLFDIQLCI